MRFQDLASLPVTAHMHAPPKVKWKVDPEGEEYVDVPEVCGAFWWAQLHSWAANIHDFGCSNCGEWAVKVASAVHDVVNYHLGKKIHDPANLRLVAESFAKAAASVKGAKARARQAPEAAPAGELLDLEELGAGARALAPCEQEAPMGARHRLSAKVLELDVTGEGDFVSERVGDPAGIDRASIRTVAKGKHRVRTGCPVGDFCRKDAGGACRVATRPIAVLHPRSEQAALLAEARRRKIPIVRGPELSLATDDVAELLNDMVRTGKLTEHAA